jgi:glucose/arabinose dehydrogenase
MVVLPLAALAGLAAFRHPVPATAPACDADIGQLTLPKGFCATVFASLKGVRHVAVAANGDVFASGAQGGVTVLRDRTHSGHADSTVSWGGAPTGTGIAIGADAIYFAPNDRVIRYSWKPGSMTPSDQGTVVVGGLPANGNHRAKTLTLSTDGKWIYVDHGSATNACQLIDRKLGEPGQNPCPELVNRAGTWRYDATKSNQAIADGERWTTGARNGMAIAIDPATGALWGISHGRDDVSRAFGGTQEQNAELPAEEFGSYAKGSDYGWPYCYYDGLTHQKKLAPEYGGDGIKQGDCGSKTQPIIAFPAHWAPMQLNFAPRQNAFGPAYADGAWLAFHGSWDRSPSPQAGYRIVFVPFKGGKPVGTYTTFADGTAGALKLSGVAMAPDGSALYIASDIAGKIWRVIPTTSR